MYILPIQILVLFLTYPNSTDSETNINLHRNTNSHTNNNSEFKSDIISNQLTNSNFIYRDTIPKKKKKY